MENKFEAIKGNQLFSGIDFSELSAMFHCIGAETKNYNKNDMILLSGNRIDFIGVVVSGSVKIVKEDISGNQTISAKLFSTELFGEVFACAEVFHSPVTIIAAEGCEVLFLDYRKVVTSCGKSCSFHARLIKNMLKLMAKKNMYLNQKIDILSKRTLRKKLLCFFEYQGKGASQFTINFNREELAGYLCADRSAVSAELSRMQKDGVLKYSKNTFELM